MPVRVPLAGEELKAFRDEENLKRRLELEEEEQRRHAAAMEKEQVRSDARGQLPKVGQRLHYGVSVVTVGIGMIRVGQNAQGCTLTW